MICLCLVSSRTTSGHCKDLSPSEFAFSVFVSSVLPPSCCQDKHYMLEFIIPSNNCRLFLSIVFKMCLTSETHCSTCAGYHLRLKDTLNGKTLSGWM